MKINANEIKVGMVIEHKGDYWNVLKTQHVKPGKGGAFNQVELKSILKGTKLNERFRSSETVEKAELEEKKYNFLYLDDENCHFMDNKTFEQISLQKNLTGDKYKLLKESLEIDTPQENSVVKGKVIAVEAGFAIVDVGYKMEGRVELKEFANPGEPPEVAVGDEVEVFLRQEPFCFF